MILFKHVCLVICLCVGPVMDWWPVQPSCNPELDIVGIENGWMDIFIYLPWEKHHSRLHWLSKTKAHTYIPTITPHVYLPHWAAFLLKLIRPVSAAKKERSVWTVTLERRQAFPAFVPIYLSSTLSLHHVREITMRISEGRKVCNEII